MKKVSDWKDIVYFGNKPKLAVVYKNKNSYYARDKGSFYTVFKKPIKDLTPYEKEVSKIGQLTYQTK